MASATPEGLFPIPADTSVLIRSLQTSVDMPSKKNNSQSFYNVYDINNNVLGTKSCDSGKTTIIHFLNDSSG
jgi:hypothetical protein